MAKEKKSSKSDTNPNGARPEFSKTKMKRIGANKKRVAGTIVLLIIAIVLVAYGWRGMKWVTARAQYTETMSHLRHNLLWELQQHYDEYGEYPQELRMYEYFQQHGRYPVEAREKGLPFDIGKRYVSTYLEVSYSSDGPEYDLVLAYPISEGSHRWLVISIRGLKGERVSSESYFEDRF